VRKVFIVAAGAVGCWLGWYLGGLINIWGSLIFAALGTGLGLYLARRFLSDL
jgi:hypothetical protein